MNVQPGRLRSEGGASIASGLSGCELDEDGTGTGQVPGACGNQCIHAWEWAVQGEEVEAVSVDRCSWDLHYAEV